MEPAMHPATSPIETAITIIQSLLRVEPLVCIAISGGKDSACLGTLALEALRRLAVMEPATVPARLVFQSGMTGVDNPAVVRQALRLLDDVTAWAEVTGHDLRATTYRPALQSSYAVKMLSGSTLPCYPGSRAKCAVDWKVEPAGRAMRALLPALAQEVTGLSDARSAELRQRLKRSGGPLVLVGTRRDESTVRAGKMAARGEGETIRLTNDGRRVAAPLANLTEDDVWEVLAVAGTAGADFPVWRESFSDLIDLYRALGGGECAVVSNVDSQRTGCGARSGCVTCQIVGEDRSLDAMVQDPRYAHLAPLFGIREFVAAIRWDWDRRCWLSRGLTTVAGRSYLRIAPDSFDHDTLITLIGAHLTADRNEASRAGRFYEALRMGRLPLDDPYIDQCQAEGVPPDPAYLDTMRKPQFCILPAREIVALDWYMAALGRSHRPFEVLEIAHQVWAEGKTFTVPTLEPVPPTPMPVARWLEFTGPAPAEFPGLASDLTEAFADECYGADEKHVTRDGRRVYAGASRMFEVDEDAAILVLDLLYPNDLRREYRIPGPTGIERTVSELLALGVITLSAQGRARMHATFQVRQAMRWAGWYGRSNAELYAAAQPILPGRPEIAVEVSHRPEQLDLFSYLAA